MLLDAKTKFYIVKNYLSDDARKKIVLALRDDDDVRQIWSESHKHSESCPKYCQDSLAEPMLHLGILKKEADYEAHFKNVTDFGVDTTARSTLVSEALTAAGPSLSSAIAEVQVR